MHVQIPLLHKAFDPHGEGLQGSEACWIGAKLIKYILIFNVIYEKYK